VQGAGLDGIYRRSARRRLRSSRAMRRAETKHGSSLGKLKVRFLPQRVAKEVQ
jgi:hypothetical protein